MFAGPNNLGLDPFQMPSVIIEPYGGRFRLCFAGGAAYRRCNVTGGEQVPPSSLGYYFTISMLV